MRMRKKPNLGPRMERCARFLVDMPEDHRGRWRELKPDAQAVWLELGCGKGRFTAEMAEQNPDVLYLAVERVPDAMIVAMERCAAKGLTNVFFVDGDAAQLRDYFAPDEVDRLFINFCDPWPSNRHAKRRLTHRDFLVLYRGILKDGGQIGILADSESSKWTSQTEHSVAGALDEHLRSESVTVEILTGTIDLDTEDGQFLQDPQSVTIPIPGARDEEPAEPEQPVQESPAPSTPVQPQQPAAPSGGSGDSGYNAEGDSGYSSEGNSGYGTSGDSGYSGDD